MTETGCCISSDRDAWPRMVTGLISAQHSTFRGIIKTSVPVIWTVIVTCHLTWHSRPWLPPPISALCPELQITKERYLFLFVKAPGASLSDVRWIFVGAPLPVSPPHPNMIITPAQGRGVLLLSPGPRCCCKGLSLWKMDNLHICEYLGMRCHLTPHNGRDSSGRGQVESRVTVSCYWYFTWNQPVINLINRVC